MATVCTDPMVGRELGGFKIRSLLGAGGMAKVYRAHQASLNREVALKVIPLNPSTDDEMLRRFEREKDVLQKLAHPHILPVYDFGVAEDCMWIAMLLVEGSRTLEGPLPLDVVCHALRQLAEALQHAHRNGVIHRDLKPANVLVADGPHLYLSDFGIAKVTESHKLTVTGSVVGTPAYIAPEQILEAQLDGRADIYSLGILIFQLVTGKLPFDGSLFSVIQQQIADAPPSPRELRPEVSPQLERVILKALEKSPPNRYANALEMADAFDAALHGRRQEAATILGSSGSPYLVGRAEEPAAKRAPRGRKWQFLLGGTVLAGFALAGPTLLAGSIRPTHPLAYTLIPSNENRTPQVVVRHPDGKTDPPQQGCAPHFTPNGLIYDWQGHLGSWTPQTGPQALPGGETGKDFWGVVGGANRRVLVFHSNRSGRFQLYRQDLDEQGHPKGEATAFVAGPGNQQWARFSPDGLSLVYSCDNRIWICGLDGRSPRPVSTPPAGASDRCADWSPDGRRLVFERAEGAGSRLVVLDLVSGAETPVALPTDVHPHHPSWQPAAELVFSSSQGIYACTPAGARLTRLVEAPGAGGEVLYPTWGP